MNKQDIKKQFEDWYRAKFDKTGMLYPSAPINAGFQDIAKRVSEFIHENYNNGWICFNFENEDSHPKKYGKYLVCKKDGKKYMETWNGIGWAGNGNVIEFWFEVEEPKK